MFFWILIVLLGIVGAVADVSLSKWGEIQSLYRWVITAALFLVFMTGFGWSMSIGSSRGYSLTAVVLVVLLANMAGVACWDLFIGGTRFTTVQWLGAGLAISAMICFELGRE